MSTESSGTLNKLLNVVQTYKGNSNAGKGGWIAGAIAAILALVVVSVLAWQQFKAGKELAKLKHEKDLATERAHRARVKAVIEDTEEAKKAARSEASRLEREAEILELRALRAENERESARKTIDRISSWGDVDAIVR